MNGWDRARQAEPDKTRIILTHTNAEVQSLNGEARDRLRASGDLGDDVTVKAERGERQFAAGDRLMFLSAERGDARTGPAAMRMAEMVDDLRHDPALRQELARRAPELGLDRDRQQTPEQVLQRQIEMDRERDRQQDRGLSR